MTVKGEMYPGTDYPKYREEFETFDDLKEVVENISEGLNHIVSWMDLCRGCAEMEGDTLLFDKGELNSFHILIFMPRKTETTEFKVTFPENVEYPHAQIDNWLMEYVQPRVMRWYGWTEWNE